MAKQREDGMSAPAQEFMANVRADGGFASGGRLHNFREGWALPMGHFGKAHYFTRKGIDLARAICERMEAGAGQLFDGGNFPRCRTCTKRRAWVESHQK